LFVAAALLLVVPARSLAQEGDDRMRRAVVLFEESERLYEQGNYAESASLLRRAYELAPDPILLFNLGRALERLGDVDGAIDAYERYLRDAPDASDRPTVEARIAELRGEPATGGGDAPPPDPETGPDREPRRTGAAPWAIAGAGAAVLGAGIGFGVVSRGRHDDAVDEPVQQEARDLQDQARTFATLANISFVVGGLVLAAGLTWGIVSIAAGGDGGDEGADVAIGPGSLSLRIRY
jgi:tetratricopeptide (TPR) repeat protein